MGIINYSVGQERINKVLPKLSATISSLTEAIGYFCNQQGQWSEGDENEIQDQYITIDSFNRFEFRTISYSKRVYLLFIKKKRSWYYKYPSIQEDMQFYDSFSYYLLDIEEYKTKLANISNDNYIEFDVLYSSSVLGEDIFKIEQDVLKFFDKSEPSTNNNKLIFQFRLFDKKNIAQFLIYNKYCTTKYSLKKRKKQDQIEQISCSYNGFNIDCNSDIRRYSNNLGSNTQYDSWYYEISLDKFEYFIRKAVELEESRITNDIFSGIHLIL